MNTYSHTHTCNRGNHVITETFGCTRAEDERGTDLAWTERLLDRVQPHCRSQVEPGQLRVVRQRLSYGFPSNKFVNVHVYVCPTGNTHLEL